MRRRTFLGTALAAVSFALSAGTVELRSIAAQVASALKPRPRGIKLPPVPKWNPKTDDIDHADFTRQVEDHQRLQFPRDTIYPHEGQIWEAVRDCEVYMWPCAEHSRAHLIKLRPAKSQVVPADYQPVPASAMKALLLPAARLAKGERVRVLATGPKPTSVRLQPLRYDQLHDATLPKEFRRFGYTGYQLVVATARPKWCLRPYVASLNEDFRPVQDPA